VSNQEVPLTIAQHLLVRNAMAVVERNAQRVAWAWDMKADLDDLRSIGKLALYRAVVRFDPTVGVPFAEFATLRVYGAMLDTVRRDARKERLRLAVEREVTRFTEYYTDDFNILQHDDPELQRRLDTFKESVLAVAYAAGLEETLSSAAEDHLADSEESARALASLGEAVVKLERSDQHVLSLLVCHKLDLQEIADELGIRHKTAAWRRVQLVLKRLREHLHAQGITRAPPPIRVTGPVAHLKDWLPPDLAAKRPQVARKKKAQ
jgi:RNA polymerase sigma factor for flagellar operon FliA